MKGGKTEKQKVLETFTNKTSTKKFFTIIFGIWRRIYFAGKHSFEVLTSVLVAIGYFLQMLEKYLEKYYLENNKCLLPGIFFFPT